MAYQDNLSAWEALLVTAQTGSISRTSILMNMDASRISRMISGLEEELGFEVLDKSRRPFLPTIRGRDLLKLAEPHIQGFRAVRDFAAGVTRTTLLRVAAPPELVQDFYAEQFLSYSALHPGIQFSVKPEASERDIREGRVDVAIFNHRPIDPTGLVIRPLLINSTPVLATPEYLRRWGTPRTPEDLAEHTGLLQESASQTPTQFLYREGQASPVLRWKRVFVTHDQITIKKLLLSHQGITVDLFIGHMAEELRNGTVVPILQGWERRPWQLTLVSRADRERESSQVQRFAEWWADIEGRESMARAVLAREAVDNAFRRQAEAAAEEAKNAAARDADAAETLGTADAP